MPQPTCSENSPPRGRDAVPIRRDDLSLPVRVLPLSRYRGAGRWRMELAHVRQHHLLIWLTRGQGRITLNGLRRGCGTHNALFVPAGTLMSLSPGPQAMGLGLAIAPQIDMGWPETPQHLRIRSTKPQAELTTLVDAIRQESADKRHLLNEALIARARLVSVWLRRQMAVQDPEAAPLATGPAVRLADRFSRQLAARQDRLPEISELAGELGVTPRMLDRVMSQCSGLGAEAMLAQCRTYSERLKKAG